MGIEYMIDFPCRPKKEMGEEHLFNLVKQARANVPKKGHGSLETAQIMDVPREGAAESAEAQLRKDLSQLDFFLSDCFSCPVNSAADKTGSGPEAAFGCHMVIEYPVGTALEKTLLAAGVDALQNPGQNPGTKLVTGILRNQPKSRKSPAHKVRRMGRSYFEAKAPLAARVEVGGKKTVLDTDQMMTLLMLGPVPPQATGAFSVMLDKGIERVKMEGVNDPWVVAPLKNLSAHMKSAGAVGKAVKVSY
jgi:hypothetical protein